MPPRFGGFRADPGSRSIATVERLRAAGFKTTIGDLGTGYSSLRYLQQFTVDSIKIEAEMSEVNRSCEL